jgi:hypothetical protein
LLASRMRGGGDSSIPEERPKKYDNCTDVVEEEKRCTVVPSSGVGIKNTESGNSSLRCCTSQRKVPSVCDTTVVPTEPGRMRALKNKSEGISPRDKAQAR